MDYRFGPQVKDDETVFRLYAPSAEAAELVLRDGDVLSMERADDGFWEKAVAGAGEGTHYKFRVGGLTFPDLASRQQEGDTTGWSIVRKPFAWQKHDEPISPWYEAVFCEVHVGTATPEGTFRALMEKLEHFRDAGYNTLEIMPINTFPGHRNWGYDGTLVFAPAEAYGTRDDFRALVDRAHELKLCIVLDVVYNHFGEVDNFPRTYCPEWFSEEVKTPWGPGINFDNPMVRQFFYENATMWLSEFDLDGLRFDAVHEIKTGSRDLFLRELALNCREVKRSAKLVIENMNNRASWLTRDEKDEPTLYTAQWNDDIHHVVNYLVTGERKSGYEDDKANPQADLEKGLRDGFVHDGEASGASDGSTGGEPGSFLPPDAFVGFVQNHDWIGNRADSKRLADRISAAKLDFVHFVAMLAPHLPLFFMGEEAHIRSPFPFFVDLEGEAAEAKKADRYKQMREIFKEEVGEGGLPDPSDPRTFDMAKLPWSEYGLDDRREALDRFRQLAQWRRELVWPVLKSKFHSAVSSRTDPCIIVTWEFDTGWLTMALNPSDWAHDIACSIQGMPVSTGEYDQNGETLRLGAWSAVAWRAERRG